MLYIYLYIPYTLAPAHRRRVTLSSHGAPVPGEQAFAGGTRRTEVVQVGDAIQDLGDELGSHRLGEVALRRDPGIKARNSESFGLI